MRSRLLPFLLCWLPIAGTFACKASASKPGSSGTGDTGVIAQVTAAICARIAACNSLIVDTTGCEAFYDPANGPTSFGSSATASAMIQQGKIKVDTSKIPACLTAIAQQPCGSEEGFQLPACAAILVGQVPDGQPCLIGNECVSGSFCYQPPGEIGSCTGTCTKIGSECDYDTDCNPGDYCTSGGCGPPLSQPGADNEGCGTSRSCQTGLVCLNEPDGYPVCGMESTLNGPCDENGLCASGYYCNTNNTAEEYCAQPAGEGQECANNDEQFSCQSGLICVPDISLTTYTCEKPAKAGQQCTDTFQCGGELSLEICSPTSHTCVPRATSGPCVGGYLTCDWRTTYCDETTLKCLPYKSPGASCSENVECGLSDQCGPAMAGGPDICGTIACSL